MKQKWMIAGLLISSLFGYLEWGNQHVFLAEAEWLIVQKLFSKPGDVIHPLILLPLTGQIVLLCSMFRPVNKILIYAAVAALSVLPVFMFLIGLMGLNWKITLSVVPYLLSIIAFLLKQRLSE